MAVTESKASRRVGVSIDIDVLPLIQIWNDTFWLINNFINGLSLAEFSCDVNPQHFPCKNRLIVLHLDRFHGGGAHEKFFPFNLIP